MTPCIDLDAKRLQNSTVLILGRETDELLGILSIETTESNYVFTIDPSKMKRLSEAEATRIVADLSGPHRTATIIKINEHTKEQTEFSLDELLFEKVVLTA